MERYALLLSGGINRLLNHPRYLNDLRLFAALTDAFGLRAYSALVQHYGIIHTKRLNLELVLDDIDKEQSYISFS